MTRSTLLSLASAHEVTDACVSSLLSLFPRHASGTRDHSSFPNIAAKMSSLSRVLCNTAQANTHLRNKILSRQDLGGNTPVIA